MYRIGSLVSYRLVSDRLVSVGSSRLRATPRCAFLARDVRRQTLGQNPADLARPRVAGASSSSQRSTGGAVCPLLALAPPAVPRESSTVRSRNQPEMCLLTAPQGSAKRTVSPHQPLSRSGSPLGGFVQACCVSVEVIRARVGAARVPFWVSFIPVMKYKPTLPRARTRAPRSWTLSHPPRATPLTR